jgi:hypothetical protein
VLGARRVRFALLACLLLSVGIPAAFTHATISTASPLWQGRYGIPFHMGVTLLAGMALEGRRRAVAGRDRAAWILGGVGLVVAHALSLVHVLLREQRTSPLRDSAAWVSVPAWPVVVLVAVAFLVWGGAVVVAGDSRHDASSEVGAEQGT